MALFGWLIVLIAVVDNFCGGFFLFRIMPQL